MGKGRVWRAELCGERIPRFGAANTSVLSLALIGIHCEKWVSLSQPQFHGLPSGERILLSDSLQDERESPRKVSYLEEAQTTRCFFSRFLPSLVHLGRAPAGGEETRFIHGGGFSSCALGCLQGLVLSL